MGAAECVVVHRQHQQSNQMMSSLMNPIWWCLRPSTHEQMKKLSKWDEDDSSLASSSSSSDSQQQRKYRKKKMKKQQDEDDVEPGSPKIGCMGQIKQHKQKQNNKIEDDVEIVSTAQLQQTICRRSINHCNKNKYFKLKNIFPATTNSFRIRNNTVTNPSTTSRCNSTKILPRNKSKAVVSTRRGSNCASKTSDDFPFNCVDMDPPLPVIKKPQPTSEGEVSDLWKRRFGGGGSGGNGVVLKGLQIDKTKRPILQHPVTL